MSDTYSILKYTAETLPREYRNMIYARWLRTLRSGNDYFKKIESRPYYSAYHSYLEKLLANPACQIRIAVLSDDHDVALGFLVHRGSVLDYVNVNKEHRRMGIGKSLIPPGIQFVTHLTKTGMLIWEQKYKHWAFNPFM